MAILSPGSKEEVLEGEVGGGHTGPTSPGASQPSGASATGRGGSVALGKQQEK